MSSVKRLARAGRCCDNVDVVQEGREALAGAQLRVCGDEGVVLAQGVQRSQSVSLLFAPFP